MKTYLNALKVRYRGGHPHNEFALALHNELKGQIARLHSERSVAETQLEFIASATTIQNSVLYNIS